MVFIPPSLPFLALASEPRGGDWGGVFGKQLSAGVFWVLGQALPASHLSLLVPPLFLGTLPVHAASPLVGCIHCGTCSAREVSPLGTFAVS